MNIRTRESYVLVTLVLRVYCHCRISEDGFGTGGCDRQELATGAISHRVPATKEVNGESGSQAHMTQDMNER